MLILQKDGNEHKKEEISRADGSFVFTRLTPGGYILQAQMTGFTTEKRQIQLGLNEVLKIDVVLQVSQTRGN
ncbi:hypothetical protein KAOT1_07948 [Kordia algicida OT-1]|uniref:TonB-dependent receptor n=1 Tax=Kordia algicida OT-1 TaxID=391587 RepID=A9DY48_9FLAO|nr:hypothetical protein KAOT1_07948 [Kordia algicida OT-1]